VYPPMIRISILFVFTFLSVITVAQILPEGVSVLQGQEFTTKGKQRVREIVLSTEDRTVAYSWDLNQLQFLVFDKNLNLINYKVLELKSGNKSLSFLKVLETTNGIYVFSTLKDEALLREVLYYQKLNMEDLTLASPKILHSKSNNLKSGAINFFVEVSENKKFLMVDVTRGKSSDSEDFGLETFDILVFDTNFDRVWREDDIVLFDDNQRVFRDKRLVANDGKVLMMALEIEGDFEDIESTEDIMSMFKYYVVVLKTDKERVLYELQSEEGFFSALNYKLADNGYLYVATVAYDSEENERSWYFSVLDIDSGNFIVENKSEFEEIEGVLFNTDDAEDDLVKLIISASNISGEPNITSHFRIEDIFVDSEGTTVTFESFAKDKSYYGQKTEILVGCGAVRFDHEGNQLWIQGIQKVQSAPYLNSPYLSTGTVNANGNISFIFNFSPMEHTQLDLKKDYWQVNSPSDLYISTIDNSGDLSINVLLEGEKKTYWAPRIFFKSSSGEIVFTGGYGKVNKLAKLSIQK